MEYREIGNTGMKVSALSFGASSLGGVFHSLREEEGIEAVGVAIDNGINFIDVSPYYGHLKAEQVLGKALKHIERNSYYLSTKVGRYGKEGKNHWDYSARKSKESVYKSMDRLNVDYIDLINVHDIEFADLNLVCNELTPEFNRRVGAEMLNNLISVKNYYAARYILLSREALGLKSSQTVDDKS